MIIVSGCPRSGTSLMMDLMRTAFGEDRILGKKFPMEEGRQQFLKQGEKESDEHYAMRMYNNKKMNPNADEELQKTKDMNPNGFWECNFTVGGISYNFPQSKLLEKLLNEDKDNLTICKIVSQGLLPSDPQYIDKIIFMVRHPRAVAKSQERLKRSHPFGKIDGKDPFDDITIHTPQMFINVTAQASRFLIENPDIPVKQILFDDLIEKPHMTLNGIKDFLDCGGNFDEAISRIEPKLRRSKHEDIDNDLWEDAEFVYEKFIKNKYQEILDYLQDPKRNINKSQARWYCPRVNRNVIESECKLCKSNRIVRNNFKKHAESKDVDWRNEPCPYECGFNPDDENPLTIEESIKNNFWVE